MTEPRWALHEKSRSGKDRLFSWLRTMLYYKATMLVSRASTDSQARLLFGFSSLIWLPAFSVGLSSSLHAHHLLAAIGFAAFLLFAMPFFVFMWWWFRPKQVAVGHLYLLSSILALYFYGWIYLFNKTPTDQPMPFGYKFAAAVFVVLFLLRIWLGIKSRQRK